LFSLIGAFSKTRGFLYLGQYMPYMFISILIVNSVDTHDKLKRLIDAFLYISIFFILTVIISAAYYRDRYALNFFLLNSFNISVNKVLTYIELPFCFIVARIVANKIKLTLIICLIMFILGIFLTGSRGSLIMVGNIFLIAGLITKKVGKPALLIVSSLVLFIFIMSTGIFSFSTERVISKMDMRDDENAAAFSRLYTMEVALKMMIDNPINGVGIGNLSYYSEQALSKLSIPHKIIEYWNRKNLFETTNMPVKMGAEMGIGGLVYFFVFYYFLWRRFKTKNKDTNHVIVGLKIFILSSFLHNFVDLGFSNYYTWFYYGTIIAASQIYYKYPDTASSMSPAHAANPI
jgi:hypothetical protein